MVRTWPILLFLGIVVFAASARAQDYPVPREREPDLTAPFGHALQLAAAERYDEAVDAFEAAARASATGVPVDALRGWGLAASEAGRPLAAYVRLRQYLSRAPLAADRAGLEDRVSRARDRLLDSAAKFSRVFASVERPADAETPGERQLARMAARDGEVSIEGMSGFRLDALLWRRAEEIPLGPYLALLRRMLDAPALIDDVPAPSLDPDAPGPRGAAVVRVVIAEEDRRVEALRGEPYERVKSVANSIIEFARTAPVIAPEPDPRPSASPADRRRAPKPRKLRR